MDGALLSKMLVWYLVFLFATTLHEAMHSFVSRYGGDYTAHEAGQTTLNPAPHIRRSPVGMVVVPILSFILNGGTWMIGWASAPFNPYWAARYPTRSFLMSLAGPFSHLPAILVSFAAMYIGLRTGYFTVDFESYMFSMAPGVDGDNLCWALALLVTVVFTLNFVLFIFNLLPVPPLDGSEVWYLFVKREEDRLRFRLQAASWSTVGILFSWYLFGEIYPIAYSAVIRFLYRAAFA